ncbi:hypothetical protein BH18ACT17_BH18ACT17_01960 [soil metagenome]
MRKPQVLRLEATLEAPALARGTVDRFRERLPEASLEDARLLVSELVTNSVLHSATAPWQQIELVLSLEDGVFRVDVSDAGVGFAHEPRTPESSNESGWGLHLVSRLADRWGVVDDSGARVWFELDTESA